MKNVLIVDTGIANFGSIESAIVRVGGVSKIGREPRDFESASHIILPGVGSFDIALKTIEQRGLRDVLARCVMKNGIPTLGVCLGMQLLGGSSDEGKLPGFGWMKGRTVKLSRCEFKVPHIGWNAVRWDGSDCLSESIEQGSRFYFVHSYHYESDNEDDVLAHVDYGGRIAAVIRQGNIIGTQFHPEKSRVAGLQLLRNFIRMSA